MLRGYREPLGLLLESSIAVMQGIMEGAADATDAGVLHFDLIFLGVGARRKARVRRPLLPVKLANVMTLRPLPLLCPHLHHIFLALLDVR